jgi:hypothetical protein
MYGLGDGRTEATKLVADVRRILEYPDRAALGAFSREFVVKHYSLEAGCRRLAGFCELAVGHRQYRLKGWSDGIRTASVLVAGRLRRSVRWPLRLPPGRPPQIVHD